MSPAGQLFTSAEQERITERSKEIFIAAIELTYKAMSNGDFEDALKLSQITHIYGVTLLGIPGPKHTSNSGGLNDGQ